MNRLLFFVFCMIFFVTAKGQKNYAEAMKQGDDAFKNGLYKIAIKKYFSAGAFDPNKKDSVEIKVNMAFDAIEALRKKAEDALAEAKKQTKIAQANYLISEAMRIVETDPTLALRLAEQAMLLNKNDTIENEANKIYAENCFYKIIINYRGGLYNVAFSKDTKKILVSPGNLFTPGIPQLWDLQEHTVQNLGGRKSSATAFAFSPTEQKIFVCYVDESAQLLNFKENTTEEFSLSNPVSSAVFSPDGQTILTGGGNWASSDTLKCIKGNWLKEFEAHHGPINSIAFSPDGKGILTGSEDSTARVWDSTGKMIRELKGHTGGIVSATFSPPSPTGPDGGKTILTGSRDFTARLWDSAGKAIPFEGHTSWISSVAFSPDGKTVLTGSYDGTARLWSLDGRWIKIFKGHTGAILSVAFSPDGKTIITGSSDGTIRLWRFGGKPMGTFDRWVPLLISNDTTILVRHGNYIDQWNVEMPLFDFLKSDKIEPLPAEQKKQYGIKENAKPSPAKGKLIKKD